MGEPKKVTDLAIETSLLNRKKCANCSLLFLASSHSLLTMLEFLVKMLEYAYIPGSAPKKSQFIVYTFLGLWKQGLRSTKLVLLLPLAYTHRSMNLLISARTCNDLLPA